MLTLNLFALSEMNNVDIMANVNERSLTALFCPLVVGSKSAIFTMNNKGLNCQCTNALVKEQLHKCFCHVFNFELQVRVSPGKTAGNRRSWMLLLVMSGQK